MRAHEILVETAIFAVEGWQVDSEYKYHTTDDHDMWKLAVKSFEKRLKANLKLDDLTRIDKTDAIIYTSQRGVVVARWCEGTGYILTDPEYREQVVNAQQEHALGKIDDLKRMLDEPSPINNHIR